MTISTPQTSGGTEIVAFSVLFATASTIVVGLRVLAARLSRRSLRPHDYLAFVATVFSIGYAVDAIVGVYLGGSGQHVEEVEADPFQGQETLIAGLKNFTASVFVWACATCLCKFSMLSLYLELFPIRSFRRAVFMTMGFVAVLWAGLILTELLVCQPFAFRWDKTLHGHCGSTVDQEISWSPVNLVADAIIVILPLPVVWKLQMPTKKKVYISCMFGLGLIICVVNATRIGLTLTGNAEDWTYALVDVAICSGIEVWLGLIAACIPTLAPILNHISGPRTSHASREHLKRSLRQAHSSRLCWSGRDGAWEIDKYGQRLHQDGLRETQFERLADDDVPLSNRGPTFQEQTVGTETIATAEVLRDEFLSVGAPQLEAGDIGIRTEISISTDSAPKY